jgi:cysteine desulfurase
MNPIYLDYAAATPVDSAALRAAAPYAQELFYNPSAVYQSAREVRVHLETARTQVAHVLGAKSKEIIFTAGGTEANNIAVHSLLSQFNDAHCVVSAIEHESVLEPVHQYNNTIVPVSKNGIVSVESVMHAITENTVLVSIMYANNEIGTIQPIKDIVAAVAVIRADRLKNGNKRPIYVHTDACQAANYLDIQLQRLGVDMMTLNGGKIYSYKQSGCLYVRTGVELKPFMLGGGQERHIRSGTENTPAIIAFATMLQKVQKRKKSEAQRLKQMRNDIIATLSQIDNVKVNGDTVKRLPNNINVTIAGADGERLVMELDEAGVMVASGSACSAKNDQPSHVLLALGHSDAEASASLRITLGAPLPETETSRINEILRSVIGKHQRLV